jgi:PEP-CTERM motif
MSFHRSPSAPSPHPEFTVTSRDSSFRGDIGRTVRRLLLASSLILVLSSGAQRAFADPIVVDFTAIHVAGTEWSYNYKLSGPYVAGDDLAIYFPSATSSNLSDLATGGADWSTFAFQPDPSLPAAGEFDALANVNNPSVDPVLSVLFQWSGSGSPGPQSFALYDPNFNVVDSGTTQASVASTPEPASLLLLGTGFIFLWLIVRRRRPNDMSTAC